MCGKWPFFSRDNKCSRSIAVYVRDTAYLAEVSLITVTRDLFFIYRLIPTILSSLGLYELLQLNFMGLYLNN